jgi:hypothetical protein
VHPVYSPDAAPSDFFLSGYLKGKIPGVSANPPGDKLSEIRRIFYGISKEVLVAVYDEWITRLEWITEHNRSPIIRSEGNPVRFEMSELIPDHELLDRLYIKRRERDNHGMYPLSTAEGSGRSRDKGRIGTYEPSIPCPMSCFSGRYNSSICLYVPGVPRQV